MRILGLIVSLLLVVSLATAQPVDPKGYRKHLIYFKDKANSPYSTNNPGQYLSERAMDRRQKQRINVSLRDLPVNPNYLTGLKSAGAQVLYTSRWFNAAVVFTDSVTLNNLVKLPFVKNGQTLSRRAVNLVSVPGEPKPTTPDKNGRRITFDRQTYGKAFNQNNQIGAIDMHAAGFRGEGMHVAVFDGGFPGIDQAAPFSHLFQENRLKGTYDFVGRDTYVFEKDNHGTNVLSTMAGYQPGTYIGTAYKANYYLFITEDSQSEHHIEEINWLLAAEYADSAGVDVINSSLGYNDFDPPSVDYRYEDLNGNRALVTRAADYAAATGMLVVNSAGNEGNKPWRYISAPADGDSVLAVGATDSLGTRVSFSSVGPTADGRIKPDISAQGLNAAILTKSGAVGRANGTSFSSPVLCGMAVGFWQANPKLTNIEVINYLKRSASQAAKPDNLLGYGIPNFNKAHELAQEDQKKVLLYPNPPQGNLLHLKVGEEYLNQPVSVTIYNLIAQRKLVQDYQLTNNNPHVSLDVSTLRSGIYICIVKGKNNNESIKFIKL